MIHRDVKPGNILLGDDGSVKIADFGIAKAMAEESGITQIGSVVGTASYLAPEQATGGEIGPAADIYALGVVTYQMLAARLPYEAESLTALALKQQREAPPLLDQLNAEVPAEVALVVDRALSLDPAMRYASAEAYANALDDGLNGVGPQEDRTRVVHPVTGATAIVPRQQIEDISRDFGDDTADHTLMQPAAARRTPREARPVTPAGGWAQSSAAAQPPRRGAVGRVFRVLLIAVLIAAIVGGAIYYVAGQQVAPRLTDVAGETVQDVSNKLDQLIRDNIK